MGNDRSPMFIVPRLFRSFGLNVNGSGSEVKVQASWSPEMVGVIPVFATYQAAQEYDPDNEPVEIHGVSIK